MRCLLTTHFILFFRYSADATSDMFNELERKLENTVVASFYKIIDIRKMQSTFQSDRKLLVSILNRKNYQNILSFLRSAKYFLCSEFRLNLQIVPL